MPEANFDWERPLPWDPNGYSPTKAKLDRERTGMFAWNPEKRCRHCGEFLKMRHGLTPQGRSLGWLLRGEGPYCYFCNMEAWQAWKRGLFHGKTALNGF